MGLFGRIVVRVLPAMPRFIVGLVAKRYVAGEDLESAVTIMKNLGAKEGCSFTIDVLGEEISNMEEAKHFVNEYDRLIDAIVENDLEANLSVKPTAFGLLIDEQKAYANMEALFAKAAEHDIFVRLDMEDHRVTQGGDIHRGTLQLRSVLPLFGVDLVVSPVALLRGGGRNGA